MQHGHSEELAGFHCFTEAGLSEVKCTSTYNGRHRLRRGSNQALVLSCTYHTHGIELSIASCCDFYFQF